MKLNAQPSSLTASALARRFLSSLIYRAPQGRALSLSGAARSSLPSLPRARFAPPAPVGLSPRGCVCSSPAFLPCTRVLTTFS